MNSIKDSHRQFKSRPSQQEPAKIPTMCGQAECTKLIDRSTWKQSACRNSLAIIASGCYSR